MIKKRKYKKRKKNPTELQKERAKYMDDSLISVFIDGSPLLLSMFMAYVIQGMTCEDCNQLFDHCECEKCDDCEYNRCMCDFKDLNINDKRKIVIDLAKKYLDYQRFLLKLAFVIDQQKMEGRIFKFTATKLQNMINEEIKNLK